MITETKTQQWYAHQYGRLWYIELEAEPNELNTTIATGSDNAEHARLIAAAPKMLAALKLIDAAPYGVALGDLEAVRAAIAKAEHGA